MKTGATTALQEFTRLEAFGRWTPAGQTDSREVSLFFGEATLVIASGEGRPITHWSLPAIRRLNPGEMPARYALDTDETEALEIDDPAMIAAVEKVHDAIARARPSVGILRRWGKGALAVAAVALVVWLPGALQRQTLSLVPASSRAEIGTTLLGLLQAETGPACHSTAGRQALDRLAQRLFGPATTLRLAVLPAPLVTPLSLPGGLLVLPQSALEAADDPYVFAGEVVAAAAIRHADDPLDLALQAAGFGTTLTLLATGKIAPESLQDYARNLRLHGHIRPDVPALHAAFAAAELTSTPWARSLGGPAVQELTVNDPMEGKPAAGVMSDADWISLKAICAAS